MSNLIEQIAVASELRHRDGRDAVAERIYEQVVKPLEAKCAALAAENGALKSAIQTHSESVHFCELCGKDDPCSTDDVCMVLSETPAADSFLAEVRAQGVEMFAREMHADISEADAIEFAAQLRKGAAA